MASEISIEKCLGELRETLLNYDRTLEYADVDIQFKDFDGPKTVIYLDSHQILHVYLDDVFSEYSAHKLTPIVLHAVRWHEGKEEYPYPKNIGYIMFTRPEFMSNIRRKFNVRYQVPSSTAEIQPELLNALDSTKALLSKIKPRMYEFSKDVQITWRKFPRNLEKSPIADVDAFCNRIFLDPAVASASIKIRAYILLHELAVIKSYNPQSLKPDRIKMEGILRSYSRRDNVVKQISDCGWRFKYEPY